MNCRPIIIDIIIKQGQRHWMTIGDPHVWRIAPMVISSSISMSQRTSIRASPVVKSANIPPPDIPPFIQLGYMYYVTLPESTPPSHPRVKVSIVGCLRDREVACSASDLQGSNFESCVWRTVSSESSHHPQEVLLAQFSLYVHKGGLRPDSFNFLPALCPLFHNYVSDNPRF